MAPGETFWNAFLISAQLRSDHGRPMGRPVNSISRSETTRQRDVRFQYSSSILCITVRCRLGRVYTSDLSAIVDDLYRFLAQAIGHFRVAAGLTAGSALQYYFNWSREAQ